MIEHNTYADGRIQSLSFTLSDGRKASVGVIEPGEYNLGTADQEETVHVFSGELIDGGFSFGPNFEQDTIVIGAGHEIKFKAWRGPVAYWCLYG